CVTLGSIGLCPYQRRLSRLVIMLGCSKSRLSVSHGGLRRIETALDRHRGDWDVPSGARGTRLRVCQCRLGLKHRDLEIRGVNDDQEIALMDELALDEIHFHHLAANAGT